MAGFDGAGVLQAANSRTAARAIETALARCGLVETDRRPLCRDSSGRVGGDNICVKLEINMHPSTVIGSSGPEMSLVTRPYLLGLAGSIVYF